MAVTPPAQPIAFLESEPVFRAAPADSLASLDAIILAGGQGSRLRTVIGERQKVMADVAGRPFVTYLLDHLAAAGVLRAILCTGFQGEQLRAELGSSYGPLRLEYSQETQPLGTAGALRYALPLLRSDPALVLNGDSFFQANLTTFWQFYAARQACASLLLAPVEDAARFGSVQIDGVYRVKSFIEKGHAAGAGWINAGVYLISKDWLAEIPAGRPVSIEHEVFPSWIGREFFAFPTPGRFLDIGTPTSYAQAGQVARWQAGILPGGLKP